MRVPVPPAGGIPAADLGEPHTPAAEPPDALRRRSVERSFGDGAIAMRFQGDTGVERFDDGSSSRARDRTAWLVRPGDPLATRTTTALTVERARAGWETELEASSSLHATPGAFCVEVRVRARADGELLRERTFNWQIPRDHM